MLSSLLRFREWVRVRGLLATLFLVATAFGTPAAQAAIDPNQGPGGPILVVTNGTANFGRYYAEILRAEGLNSFAVADISSLTSTVLSSYDVVVLAKTPLTGSQVTALTNWVNAGGNLIAMDPDAQLYSLAGVTTTGTQLANAYLRVDTATNVGNGIVGDVIQFHGTASRYSLSGASALATLYSNATTGTTNPAVTLRSVGANGGQVAFFSYDLATSIVYTRQGNPAWVGQERDGISPLRSDDLFYGPAAGDLQPNWIDLNKVAIPQADEQQRFFANLITQMNLDRKPLPRFWYLPNGHKAAVIMTGDDHAYHGTAGRFEQLLAASPPNCSVNDWECLRGTSYIYPNTTLTDVQAAAYVASGFEISLHLNTFCGNYTESELNAFFSAQLADLAAALPSIPTPVTERIHCIAWNGWVMPAKVELGRGMRLDTNYYYWPPGWVSNVPGHFTGSAMPMRFADLDGSLVDVFQAVSQMTDESGQTYPYTIDTLLDRALGAEEQYGVYTINAHTDYAVTNESTSTIDSALSRGVPIVSAKQMLTWLDGRDASAFSSLAWSANQLSFTVTAGVGANGLTAIVPRGATNGLVLTTVQRNGSDVPFEIVIIKGLEYAKFPAQVGNYVAAYAPDAVAPTIVSRSPTPGASGVSLGSKVVVRFSEPMDPASVSAASFELRDAGNAPVSGTVSYDAGSLTATLTPVGVLASGQLYTAFVRGGLTDPRVKDAAGNALVSTSSWSFGTTATLCPCTIWPESVVPGIASSADTAAVELGVRFRSDIDGFITGLRFYKGSANTGNHTGHLWTNTGQLLASATFTNESASGWQQVTFDTPVAVTANTVYVASYHAPSGKYALDSGYFTNKGADNGVLHALQSGVAGGNGVYTYGAAGSFPVNTWESSNYWIDVVFGTQGSQGPDVTAPTISISAPTSNATLSTSSTSIALGGSASDNVGVTQVSWNNDRGGTGLASGTQTWTVANVALQSGTNVLTVTATDAAGNSSTDVLTVVYTPAQPDSTPPTIAGRVPVAGATGVAVDAPIVVTFSEAMDVATINSSTIELRTAANVLVSASVTYAGTNATVTPAAPLAVASSYQVTVKGGSVDPAVKDVSGNPLATTSSWAFTTAAQSASSSIWNAGAVPGTSSSPDTASVELGVKFRADVDGQITGIRFYKGPANAGTHVGKLWSSTGQLLASATFVGETATGWQQVLFSTPVDVVANTVYVASYLAPSGGYALDSGFFSSNGVDNGVLHALSGPAAGGNGVYAYGAGSFPSSSWQDSNYWVDVVFVAASTGPDTVPPTITGRAPASGATNVATNSAITVTFSEAMDPATISGATLEIRDQANALVASSVTYSGTTATIVPTAQLANAISYSVTVKGGSTDPRVKDVAGNALAANVAWTFTTASAGGPCSANPITAENCLTGNPASEWDVSGAGDPSIQGFATQISVNRGSAISFKVDTTASNYRFDIYRMGYYGGLGARKIATVSPSASLPQNQPSCLTQASSGLIDCGNWAVSGSWTVPANAVSGIYFAKVVRTDTGGASHIVFVVRDDASTSDLVFQTSDTTWHAYNNYGGNSLYTGGPGTNPGRAYKVSYNRPFATRAVNGGEDWVFNAEYPMIRWLESNGYNVSYISGVDTDRAGSLLLNHRTYLSVGHDEYWSGQQRANVEAARAAGVHLAFFSGNEVFWKTRWETSIDGTGTAYRTLVSYKETQANAKIDPSAEWTGTWRDPRFSPPADGGRPENALSGTMFTVNSGTSGIVVPAAEGKMRFWRNTSIASLGAGQSATLPMGVLGYEWDSDLDNGFRPAGLVRLSDTTVAGVDKLQDFGSTYASGTSNHALTFYKHTSGARVFGAGTIQWAWGLDATHDRAGTPADVRMQQATVNLLADMNVQPATLRSGLVAASASTDGVAPSVSVSAPTAGATVPVSSAFVIAGTATDSGGVVGGVEVSVDGGATWRMASGRDSWTYSWIPTTTGAVTIRVRAVDDSGNLSSAATVAVTVGTGSASCPCSIWNAAQVPGVTAEFDPTPVELGTRFRANADGVISAIRFYKDVANTGTHVGSLWSASGTLLGQVTFTGESASGWQQAQLATPVAITANTWYVVSYHTNAGAYTGQDGYFAASGVTNGPLYAARDGEGGANGLYTYSPGTAFPTQTYFSENYWVDVVYNTSGGTADTVAPVVTITTPTAAATFASSGPTVALGGTASDAVGVTQVTWANSAGGSGSATGTSTWSIPSVALQAGSNVLTVTARDAAGNSSTDVLTVTYAPDTTAPVVTITSPTSQATFVATGATVSLAGSASDAVGVSQVTWSSDRGGSGTASGTTTWSVSNIALQAGTNVLTVTALDAAGNSSTDVLSVTYAGDTTAPVVTITSPVSTPTYTASASNLSIGGTASDAVGVTQVSWANDRGGAGTATGTTAWSASNIVLQTGTNVLTVTARDAAGNSSTDVLTVTLAGDTTAPVVTITAPTTATTFATTATTITLSGTSSDATGVTQVTWVNGAGGSGTATGTTSWSVANIALVVGSNVLSVTAVDAAGNSSTDVLTVTRTADTTAPVVTITTPTTATTLSTTASTLALGGTASDAIGVTQVSWVNSAGGSGVATGTTAWSVASIPLVVGSNVLTVTASDAAGNSSTDVLTVTRTSDTTAPVVTITTPTTATTFATTATTLTLGGTSSDAVGVTQVTWVNSAGGGGTATGTTSWSVTGLALAVGSNVLTVTARDAAGNTSTDVLTVTRTVADTTAPVVTIAAPTSATTFATTGTTVALSGTSSDNVGVTQVTWTNSRGGSGTAAGTATWSIASVALSTGSNVITVTARDAAGNTSTDVITVTRDSTLPAVTITSPTLLSTLTTTASTLSLGGTASDNVAVTQVSWTSSRGGSGVATGTTAWSATGIALLTGSNVLTVTARDAAGNTRTDTLTVTRN